MPERAYLSIGEVLSLLKDEFVDITISKIRFLESQGLIDPERTPSGYRKFYDPDVERLRWILRQQKEHYLPLRVIKGKLSEARPIEEAFAHPTVQIVPQAPPALMALPDPPPEPSRRPAPPFPESLRRSTRASPVAFLTAPEPTPPPYAPSTPTRPQVVSPVMATPPPPSFRDSQPAPAIEVDDEESEQVELAVDELAAACGLTISAVAELERYGLIESQRSPTGRYYDAAALEVARLAAAFAEFGVEARHLKMWKTGADREAGVYQQVVTPLRAQRGPKARHQAVDTIAELAVLGARLHSALVAEAMKRLT